MDAVHDSETHDAFELPLSCDSSDISGDEFTLALEYAEPPVNDDAIVALDSLKAVSLEAKIDTLNGDMVTLRSELACLGETFITENKFTEKYCPALSIIFKEQFQVHEMRVDKIDACISTFYEQTGKCLTNVDKLTNVNLTCLGGCLKPKQRCKR